MKIKVLMVDIDGVIIVNTHRGGWSAKLESGLGFTVSQLQEAFFKPHFNDIIHG